MLAWRRGGKESAVVNKRDSVEPQRVRVMACRCRSMYPKLCSCSPTQSCRHTWAGVHVHWRRLKRRVTCFSPRVGGCGLSSIGFLRGIVDQMDEKVINLDEEGVLEVSRGKSSQNIGVQSYLYSFNCPGAIRKALIDQHNFHNSCRKLMILLRSAQCTHSSSVF